MHLDVLSFLSGFITASVIATILYRFRDRIAALRRTAEASAGSTRRFITNSAESRYYSALVKTLNAYHIAGDIVKLSDIFVEPRFIRAIEVADPAEDRLRSVFHVIPMIHDLPYSYGPYNVETLSVSDLGAGDNHLALLGIPGAGKSVALAIMALYTGDEVKLETLDTISDQIFEDELKDLAPVEREKATQQRHDTQERALAQLKLAQKKRDEDQEGTVRPVVDFHNLLPILIHLRNIDLRPEAFGLDAKSKGQTKALDPAEPLVRALQTGMGTVTASSLPRMIYNRLNDGSCLVLIDGYDELAPYERSEKLTWIQQFIEIYGANFIVVAGPATGYDPLVNLGLTPVFLRAWMDSEFEMMIQKWTAAWPMIAGKGRRRAAMPDERLVRRAETNNRGRVPLDITLKTWTAFTGDEQEVGRLAWYDYFVRRGLNTKETRSALEHLAGAILDLNGAPLTKEQAKEALTAAFAGEDGKPTTNVDEMLGKLTAVPSLVASWPGGHISLTHPLLTGFLAAYTLGEGEKDRTNEIASIPAWDIAMPFAAAKVSIDNLVNQRLQQFPDLLYRSLFDLATWLPDAAPNVPWRAEVFKRLTAALLAPSQYPTVRERAMAAMVASRDRNIMFILKQALRSPDPVVRRLGCVGLGALGDGEVIKDLSPMLTDADADTQLSAGLALGAIGTEAALQTMLAGFVGGDPALRQAVAEALAAIPGEGHAVLRDAIASRDMMQRRAAVFGLARIKSAWSLSLLYRALLEDEQWYVRNAAEQAFLEVEQPEQAGATKHPEADALPWLIAWAAQKGEGVPAGPNARQVLIRVLQEGDPAARSAAARTLAALGHVPALKPLYGALRDRDENVRAAVYGALGTIESRIGEALPAVM